VAKMRFIKDRYFKTPPLVDEDYTALLLKVHDTTRSPRGTPKAQMTAEIGRLWHRNAHTPLQIRRRHRKPRRSAHGCSL
jgi:hypothetical protein